MVCSIVVAFTEAALKIASLLGFDGRLRGIERIHGGRRVIEHAGGRGGGGGALSSLEKDRRLETRVVRRKRGGGGKEGKSSRIRGSDRMTVSQCSPCFR